MCDRLVELMRETIHDDYELERQGCEWLLRETGTGKSIRLRAANRRTFAFKLDHQGKARPMGFFSASPPRDIEKMCDAIMACHYGQRCYLFIIEWKTADKGEYKKQLKNGRLFCDWLLRLYKEYGHIRETPVFVRLLVWSPRPSPQKGYRSLYKGETDTLADWDKPSAARDKDFDHAGEIQNRSMIPMQELLGELKRKELRKTA